MRNTLWVWALALGLAVGAGCGDDDDGTGPGGDQFRAELDVASEVPPAPNPTDATGEAVFDVVGNEIEYAIRVSDITGVIAAHIHVGGPTVAGPIVVLLFEQAAPGTGPLDDDILVEGAFDADSIRAVQGNPAISLDSLVVLMGNNNTYVNVHTVANPGGEIRGQVEPD